MFKNIHPKNKNGGYLVPSRVPDSLKQAEWETRPKVERTSERELRETADRIEQNLKRNNKEWVKIENCPYLVYETQNRFHDTTALDMIHGNESREAIEQYGFMQPFKESEYYSHRDGYTHHGEALLQYSKYVVF